MCLFMYLTTSFARELKASRPLLNMRSADASLELRTGLLRARHDSTVTSRCSSAVPSASHGTVTSVTLLDALLLAFCDVTTSERKSSGMSACRKEGHTFKESGTGRTGGRTHVEAEVEQINQTADLVAEQHVVAVLEAGAAGCAVDAARVHERPTTTMLAATKTADAFQEENKTEK